MIQALAAKQVLATIQAPSDAEMQTTTLEVAGPGQSWKQPKGLRSTYNVNTTYMYVKRHEPNNVNAKQRSSTWSANDKNTVYTKRKQGTPGSTGVDVLEDPGHVLDGC